MASHQPRQTCHTILSPKLTGLFACRHCQLLVALHAGKCGAGAGTGGSGQLAAHSLPLHTHRHTHRQA
jgi:hypothetical protein